MASRRQELKWVPGTSFLVDGFEYCSPRCSHYFLTHCHADHTIGLRHGWDAGTLYCSPVSARLLAVRYGLTPPRVAVLHTGKRTIIDGIAVTALDANHCPGALMLLFEMPHPPGTVLHTGDCRWRPGAMAAAGLGAARVHTLMLDTTYATPRWTLPPQADAISRIAEVWYQPCSCHWCTECLLCEFSL